MVKIAVLSILQLGHSPDSSPVRPRKITPGLAKLQHRRPSCGSRPESIRMTSINREDPRQPEIQTLLAMSDAFSMALYPQEGRHPVDAELLASSHVRFFVARMDGRAVGCAALIIAGDGTAELKRMMVVSAARGHGVGTALLEHAEAAAIGERVQTVRLETGPLSHAAIRLYLRLGYRKRGPFPPYKAGPHSVFMEKRLT
jgi:putative acetyltransferase